MDPNSFIMSNSIVSSLFDFAKRDKKEEQYVKTTERTQLYNHMDKLADYIENKKNPNQEIMKFSQAIISEFKKHYEDDEAELLARWLARNTSHKSAEELDGAYKSFHHLFDAISKTIGEKELENAGMIVIDSTTKKYILYGKKDLYTHIGQVNTGLKKNITEQLKLDTQSLLQLKLVSRSHHKIVSNKMVLKAIVKDINSGKTSLNKLGIQSLQEVVDKFGEVLCTKMERLDFLKDDLKGSFPTEKFDLSLITKFPNLKELKMHYYVIDFELLRSCHKLESLILTKCDGNFLTMYLKDCHKLKKLIIKDNDMGYVFIDTLEYFPALEIIDFRDITGGYEESMLKSCLNLKEVDGIKIK